MHVVLKLCELICALMWCLCSRPHCQLPGVQYGFPGSLVVFLGVLVKGRVYLAVCCKSTSLLGVGAFGNVCA